MKYIKTEYKSREYKDLLLIGNGQMGVMNDGHPTAEIFYLNDEKFWTGVENKNKINPSSNKDRKYALELLAANKYQEAHEYVTKNMLGDWSDSYTPVGNFQISYDIEAIENSQSQLDTNTGVITSVVNTANNSIEKVSFIDYFQKILLIKIKSEKPISFKYQLELTNGLYSADVFTARSYVYDQSNDGIFDLDNDYRTDMFGDRSQDVYIDVETDGNYEQVINNGQITNSCETIITISFDSPLVAEFSQALQTRQQLFSQLINKTKLIVDESPAAAAYEMSKYYMISSMMNSQLPANLQGIWNKEKYPAWRSNYTININLEMNYWPILTLGFADEYETLLKFIKNLADKGRETASQMYNARGWVAHHNTDGNYQTAPTKGDLSWSYWPYGSAWLVTHIWEHYLFTNDRDVLKSYYNVIEESAIFYVDYLGDDMNFGPSVSPENLFYFNGEKYSLTNFATQDKALVKELFEIAVRAAAVLEIDSDNLQEIKTSLSKITDIYQVSNEKIMEWDIDYEEVDPNHRHLTHLLGVYPFHYSFEDDLKQYALNSVKSRDLTTHDQCGWSEVHRACMYYMLGDYQNYQRKVSSVVNNQMHDNYLGGILTNKQGPYQIDANAGFLAAVNLGIAHSTENGVELLASPTFASGEIENYCLFEGMTISMKWQNYKLESFIVKAKDESKKTIKVIYENNEYLVNTNETISALN